MDFGKIDEGHADGEEQLVFYYNREDRIKRSPEIVKKYYNGELNRKRGLFRVLVSTKGNRMMLFVLVVCFIITGFIGFFGPSRNTDSINGVNLELKAFSYEDKVYASFCLKAPGKKHIQEYNGQKPVKVVFTAYDADNQSLFTASENGIYEGKEMFLRTAFTDYDIYNIGAEVWLGDVSKSLSCAVEKR